MMNGRGKSDRSMVPRKPPNKAGQPAAEVVEGKDLAEGNSPEGNAFRTQCRGDARSALERVRRAARKDRKQKFTALFHNVYDVERLRAAYLALKRDASPGADGETWQHYGEKLEDNLANLADRLKRGAYYGVPGNGAKLGAFRKAVIDAWLWTLRRRGQAHPVTWERMSRYVDRWIPTVRIHHPWPSERFGVTTRGKSRMR